MGADIPPNFDDVMAAMQSLKQALEGVALVCNRDGDRERMQKFSASADQFDRHRLTLYQLRRRLAEELGVDIQQARPAEHAVAAPEQLGPGFAGSSEPPELGHAVIQDEQFGQHRRRYLQDCLSDCSLDRTADIAIAVGRLYREILEHPPDGLTSEAAGYLRGAVDALPPLLHTVFSDGRKTAIQARLLMRNNYQIEPPAEWGDGVTEGRLFPFLDEFEAFQAEEKARRTQQRAPQPTEPGARPIPEHVLRSRRTGGPGGQAGRSTGAGPA